MKCHTHEIKNVKHIKKHTLTKLGPRDNTKSHKVALIWAAMLLSDFPGLAQWGKYGLNCTKNESAGTLERSSKTSLSVLRSKCLKRTQYCFSIRMW